VPRIDVPAGRDPLLHLWSGTGNELTGPAAAFSDAVYRKSTLPSLDHLGMDDAFWARPHAFFSDDELVRLGLCVGSWLAFGRLNRVFGVDEACRIPLAPHGPGRGQQIAKERNSQ
jgi:hypothetical protein